MVSLLNEVTHSEQYQQDCMTRARDGNASMQSITIKLTVFRHHLVYWFRELPPFPVIHFAYSKGVHVIRKKVGH